MNIEDKFSQNQILFNSKFNSIGNDTDNTEQSNQSGTSSFSNVLKSYLDDTNDKMTEADSTTNKFVKGEDVSIDEVMIKNQEASLDLQFLAQTRDKLLDGYNQLIKMQL